MQKKHKIDIQTSKITSKGQTTLPVEVRNFLKLNPGDSVSFIVEHNVVQMRKAEPLDLEYHRALEATLSGEWNSKEDNDAYRNL